MARLVFIISAILIGMFMSDYCSLKYPVVHEYYNNLWDKLKHQMYLVFALACCGIAYFKEESKYEPVEILNRVLLSFMVFGMIPQMILEKNQNRFLPHEPMDYIWMSGSLLIGLLHHLYVRGRSKSVK